MSEDPRMDEILADCKFFTTEWQLKILKDSEVWYMVNWAIPLIRQKPPNSFRIWVVICQDQLSQVIIPCFFGLYPDLPEIPEFDLFYRFLQVMKLKSTQELNPRFVYAEYEENIRRAISSVFPQATLIGSYAHRAKLLYEACKHVKCSLLGIKTAVLTRTTHFFIAYILVISMMTPEEFVSQWSILKGMIDNHSFAAPIALIEKEFLSPEGLYFRELSYKSLIDDKGFRVSTPAIEGYHYRVKQLIKAYGVSSLDMLVDKVITSEEKHFSSKVAEVNLGRIMTPEMPEKFFFERSMGTLPISTTVADIYGLIDTMDPKALADLLMEPTESKAIPQRKALVSLWQLDEYKSNLISLSSVSNDVIDRYIERKRRYKRLKAEIHAKSTNGNENAEEI